MFHEIGLMNIQNLIILIKFKNYLTDSDINFGKL